METREVYQTKNSKTETAQFHLRLPDDLLLWLKRQAQKNDRSVTSEIVHSLKFYRSVAEVVKLEDRK